MTVEYQQGHHSILMEKLNTHLIAAKFILRLLIEEQKQQHVAISQKLLHHANDKENFLKNTVMGDKTWVCRYDVETKRQSSQKTSKFSQRPKKACHACSNIQNSLIIFFGYMDVTHHEFVPIAQTVNKEFSLEVLRHL
jgi:hypothetical protein